MCIRDRYRAVATVEVDTDGRTPEEVAADVAAAIESKEQS